MRQPIPLRREDAEEALRVARAILSGSTSIIDGARRMASIHLYSGHVKQPIDEDYALFLEIDSKTSHLPVGEARKHWSAEALARKDIEVQQTEAVFRERALKAAEAFIHRHEKKLNHPPPPTSPSRGGSS